MEKMLDEAEEVVVVVVLVLVDQVEVVVGA